MRACIPCVEENSWLDIDVICECRIVNVEYMHLCCDKMGEGR